MRNFYCLFGSGARLIIALALCGLGNSKAMAQGERSDYVPFVEEGKSWYCVCENDDDSVSPFKDPRGNEVDCIFTMHGDTLINDKEYKKVYCQFEEYFGDKEQHYYCAVREEVYQVFVVEEKTAEEKLIYDFSQPEKRLTFIFDDIKYVRNPGGHRYDFLPGQLEYDVCKLSGDEIEYSNGSSSWIDGVGACNYNPFAIEMPFLLNESKFGKGIDVVTCMKDGKCIYDIVWRAEPVVPYEKQCATPTIAYDNGKLLFSCETPGAECVYEIKCTDAGCGSGGEVSLSRTYEIRVHATLDGYEDSDVAVATIGWRNGRPLMEGFSSVTMDGGYGNADVNGDGKVDVADIATVISVMAGQQPE